MIRPCILQFWSIVYTKKKIPTNIKDAAMATAHKTQLKPIKTPLKMNPRTQNPRTH